MAVERARALHSFLPSPSGIIKPAPASRWKPSTEPRNPPCRPASLAPASVSSSDPRGPSDHADHQRLLHTRPSPAFRCLSSKRRLSILSVFSTEQTHRARAPLISHPMRRDGPAAYHSHPASPTNPARSPLLVHADACRARITMIRPSIMSFRKRHRTTNLPHPSPRLPSPHPFRFRHNAHPRPASHWLARCSCGGRRLDNYLAPSRAVRTCGLPQIRQTYTYAHIVD